MNETIYYQRWSEAEGLGDMLQISTLPRRFPNFYLSDRIKYRNQGILDLLLLDPHIKGISSKEPNLVFNNLPFKTVESRKWIRNIEATFGFDPPYSERPIIYYKPKVVEEVRNASLVDLSVISIIGIYRERVARLTKTLNETLKGEVFQVVSSTGQNVCICYPPIQVRDIWHYCDLVHSCKRFYCLQSGGSIVAAALRPTETYCLLPAEFYYNQVYWNNMMFEGIDYIPF